MLHSVDHSPSCKPCAKTHCWVSLPLAVIVSSPCLSRPLCASPRTIKFWLSLKLTSSPTAAAFHQARRELRQLKEEARNKHAVSVIWAGWQGTKVFGEACWLDSPWLSDLPPPSALHSSMPPHSRKGKTTLTNPSVHSITTHPLTPRPPAAEVRLGAIAVTWSLLVFVDSYTGKPHSIDTATCWHTSGIRHVLFWVCFQLLSLRTMLHHCMLPALSAWLLL